MFNKEVYKDVVRICGSKKSGSSKIVSRVYQGTSLYNMGLCLRSVTIMHRRPGLLVGGRRPTEDSKEDECLDGV